MSGWNHPMKGELYTGGDRPSPAERGRRAQGLKQEVLLMGPSGKDTAPAKHSCQRSGTSRPRLYS